MLKLDNKQMNFEEIKRNSVSKCKITIIASVIIHVTQLSVLRSPFLKIEYNCNYIFSIKVENISWFSYSTNQNILICDHIRGPSRTKNFRHQNLWMTLKTCYAFRRNILHSYKMVLFPPSNLGFYAALVNNWKSVWKGSTCFVLWASHFCSTFHLDTLISNRLYVLPTMTTFSLKHWRVFLLYPVF